MVPRKSYAFLNGTFSVIFPSPISTHYISPAGSLSSIPLAVLCGPLSLLVAPSGLSNDCSSVSQDQQQTKARRYVLIGDVHSSDSTLSGTVSHANKIM